MKDKLCYILDPKEGHGEDPSTRPVGQSGRRFPGETFHVVKEKEIRLNIMPQESLILCLRKLIYCLEEEFNDMVSSVNRIS